MEAFTIRNLSFAYPETEVDVLKDINFSVIEGEFLTVCGASGSGKSTLLRLLMPDLVSDDLIIRRLLNKADCFALLPLSKLINVNSVKSDFAR